MLAHLIATEREIHAWIARRVEGQEADFGLRANQPVRIRAIISTFPLLASLAAELKRNQAETVAMAYDLPEEFVRRRRSYWRVGYGCCRCHLAPARPIWLRCGRRWKKPGRPRSACADAMRKRTYEPVDGDRDASAEMV